MTDDKLSYQPTNRLRFVERVIPLYTDENGVTTGRQTRILQQWWEDGGWHHINTFSSDGKHVRPGEWRDIPLEDV